METQLNDTIEKIRTGIEKAEIKIKRYKKTGRFKFVNAYWSGVRDAYLHALDLLEK